MPKTRLAAQLTFIIRQGIERLESLDDEVFTRTVPGLRSGSVGAQFRHVIDMITCMLRDLSSGRIDYDRRERDWILKEIPQRAAERMRLPATQLEGVANRGTRSVTVKADQLGTGVRSLDWISSTFERELVFLLSHTVHHYALIALMLRGIGVEVAEEFGVAPSTLQYWKAG